MDNDEIKKAIGNIYIDLSNVIESFDQLKNIFDKCNRSPIEHLRDSGKQLECLMFDSFNNNLEKIMLQDTINGLLRAIESANNILQDYLGVPRDMESIFEKRVRMVISNTQTLLDKIE